MSPFFTESKDFLKKTVTENLGLKLTAAVIALLLYTLVAFQEKETERILDVELVPPLPDPTAALVLTTEFPDTVRVRLRGPWWSKIKSLEKGDIDPVNLDLSKFKEGTSYFYFTKELFAFDSDLEFVRVTPESVQVKMERLVSRQLPVRVRTYGKLKTGTEFIEEPKVEPTTVSVIGAASVIRGLKNVETEDVDIEGNGVGEHVSFVPAKRIDGVSIRKGNELKVGVRVRWIPGKRMISGLLVQARGTELSVDFKPKQVAVALAGPQVALDKLDPAKILPIVFITDEENNRPGTYQGNVDVLGLPESIKLTSIVPKRVQVRLTTTGTGKLKKGAPTPKKVGPIL